MNTPNQEIQQPAVGRRHARYSDEFRRQVVAVCQAPGVSKAAIALANGLNANMLRCVRSSNRKRAGGQHYPRKPRSVKWTPESGQT